MAKILRPVDPAKRLPDTVNDNPMFEGMNFSGAVLVRFINKTISESFSGLNFAYFSYNDKKWVSALPEDHFTESGDNLVTEWYEEIDIESLFPDTDLSYHVAKSAAKDNIAKISIHQEGQTFVQNHILKQLKNEYKR